MMIRCLVFILLHIQLAGANQLVPADEEFCQTVSKWFNAWELVSHDVYGFEKVLPVEFVFFDDLFVYTTDNATLHEGKKLKGPSLMNLSPDWYKQPHHDSIYLPDGSVVPVQIMSFAGPVAYDTNKAFFVMPLPPIWKKAGVSSDLIGFEKFLTGIFIHEFSHSQQMRSFGRRLSEIENSRSWTTPLSDDYIQELFQGDSIYTACYLQELELIEKAVRNNHPDLPSLQKAFTLMQDRHQRYFVNDNSYLKELDQLFLTMEGLGQYSMYAWLTHPRGGRLEKHIAVDAVRRKGKWWSQEQGFLLFLALEKMGDPRKWAKTLFGESVITVFDLFKSGFTPHRFKKLSF